jgi:hypothetical protein
MRCYNGMYGECLRAMEGMCYRTCELTGIDIRLMIQRWRIAMIMISILTVAVRGVCIECLIRRKDCWHGTGCRISSLTKQSYT